MKSQIRKCPRCGRYTIYDECPLCSSKTVSTVPPNWSIRAWRPSSWA
ncbi:MAG: hypothetical protein IIT75_01485 [Candidatus Methanomethylophilus sp.]|nr:hypothetical protein [Methanomethylophilus sp.]